MNKRFDQWMEFLAVDDATTATLSEFSSVLSPHIESIMDAVYARISSNAAAAAMFATSEVMHRARAAQKQHWQSYVFAGKFDGDYVEATRAIGRAHYRIGVDLMLFMGTCTVVMDELMRIVTTEMVGRPADQARYLSALNRAIYLDMGLATSVYYDSLLGALEEMAQELTFSLARAGEFRDNETGRHISRMSKMCHALARAVGMDVKWAQMLQVASPLHDVGKIGIPDEVLLKPGRLTEKEFDVMRRHPMIGGDIIPEHPSDVIRMARRVSLTHHERWDGSGYPAGLRGEEIPIEGRIAAICDVYDALVSNRPYKQPWPREKAVAYLQENSGIHFDPRLVEAFLSILPEIDSIQAAFADSCPPSAVC